MKEKAQCRKINAMISKGKHPYAAALQKHMWYIQSPYGKN
jgi:hypothetical protein